MNETQFRKKVGNARYFLETPPTSLNDLIDKVVHKNQRTFFKTGRCQCTPRRRRSVVDIARIILAYYPETTTEEILSLIAKKIKQKKFTASYCVTVRKLVTYDYGAYNTTLVPMIEEVGILLNKWIKK